MTNIPTRSIAQLPVASSISTNDVIPIQQSGITKQATVGSFLSGAQIPSVLGYSSLRSYYGSGSTVPAGSLIFVRGVAAVGFGEGLFYYDNVASSSDNGGTVIVDNQGRRWLRVMDDIIDVKWFGAVGNGVVDDTAAIQAAISAAEDPHMRGNTVLLSSCSVGYALTSVGLVIGNGTAGGTFSTKSPISLQGQGAVSGIGAFNPTGGGALISSVSGPAIDFRGPMIGWNLNNVFISFGTSATTADGVRLIEAQYGSMDGLTITNCPGTALKTTTYGNNNVANNKFDNVAIYMPVFASTAIGTYLSGTSLAANTAHNTFTNLHVIPTTANHKALVLGYCDANHFINYETVVQAGAIAVQLKYDDGPNDFPSSNTFYSPDFHTCTVTVAGSASNYAIANPNRITNLLQLNGTAIPQGKQGLAIDRLALQGDQTFYVSPVSGSDTTNYGLVPASAWATLQFGYETIANYYDLNGYTATLRAADGTYSVGLSAGTPLTGGNFRLKFNGSGAIVNTAAAPILKFTNNVRAQVSNGNLTGVGSCIDVDNGAYVRYGGQVFNTTAQDHVRVQNGGVAEQIAGTAFIVGNAASHIHVLTNGVANISGRTIQALASASFSDSFVKAESGGMVQAVSTTFTNGTWLSGRRFNLSGFGSVVTSNAGGSYFPGTINGVNYNPTNRILAQSAVEVSVGASTTRTVLATIPVSAGVIGPNGQLRITTAWEYTNSGNNKTMDYTFGGTTFLTLTRTTDNAALWSRSIYNAGAENSQVASGWSSATGGEGAGGGGVALVTATIDTAVSQSLEIAGTKASAGESLRLRNYTVEVIRGPQDGTYT